MNTQVNIKRLEDRIHHNIECISAILITVLIMLLCVMVISIDITNNVPAFSLFIAGFCGGAFMYVGFTYFARRIIRKIIMEEVNKC